jgi:hypothetical protein
VRQICPSGSSPRYTRFYVYTPLRPLEVIDAELKAVQAEIQALRT